MRAVVQRVLNSILKIENKEYSKIGQGLIVFLGVSDSDTVQEAKVLAEKITKLRIFEDKNGKMNLSVADVSGSLHVISQFTLYADCHHGNRPSFINAGKPEIANSLYEQFIEYLRQMDFDVATGIFGADMKINYTNDGPITIMLECVDGKIL